ncbi:DUF4335 domain-containing protein [Oscillatoria sp. FACHB-1407]|uniref:DUF4335 domain-containing protein n=1 Tax=Oscillatoria sp. FACHB-1407 TaxID=2692847 RepID=UPI001683D0CD|nr:DUF4335 domain-containing protein [Oscillatoria sp. FACHB-1407]MBD2462506.1 DUF4335 domain-containing protein [Oscillatoria sp. FACHB-1407]
MPSVFRRYTPPTCTLEISANESPLSRWTDPSVLKHLRFQLSFDDPRLLPEDQVHVTGSRTQLEALHEAVETYVQTILDAAPVQFNQRFMPSASEAMRSDSSDGGSAEPMISAASSNQGNYTNGERLRPASAASPAIASPPSGMAASQNIFLRPKGLLNHELHLGTLATEESGIVVSLSTLQLFDLANALDEYAADAVALPSLSRPAWMQSRAGWLRIAAIAVVALGVTTTLGKFVMDVSSPELQTASSPAQDPEVVGAPESFSTAPPVPPALDPTKTPPDLTAVPTPIPTGTLPAVPVPGTVPPAGSTVPTRPTNIPPLPQLAPIPQQNAQPGAIASAPPNSQIQIPTRPSVAQAPPLPAAPSAANDSAAARQAAPEGAATLEDPSSSQAAGASRGTAFDTIPQVAELRDYFQQRWTPPDALNQTLEYRLSVGADGTLQQITPLGQASSTYVDRTGIPLTGEPLVSPLENANSAQIRLVLSPDGRVQTFLEGTQ